MKIDMIGQTKEKIKECEERIANPETSEWSRQNAQASLKRYQFKLQVLEKSDMDKTVNDMKAIMSHTKAIEQKYECRSVKFMFWFSEFVGRFSPKLGEKIKKYAVKEIHAPVCSIVSGTKPELLPMPNHSVPNDALVRKEQEIAELKRLSALTGEWLSYKPTRMELFKERIRTYINKKLT
jgi:hypothetical protein